MSLTALEVCRLEDDARTMATNSPRGYLSDALQCLRDTGHPIAPLALLRAMWTAGHARRDHQEAALDGAGQWLERRLGRDPGISPDRLVLELGWLRRLVTIHGGADDADDGGDRHHRLPSRGAPRRDEPAFGTTSICSGESAKPRSRAPLLPPPFSEATRVATPIRRAVSTSAETDGLPGRLERGG